MRFPAIFLALLALIGLPYTALARDDLMPPPKPAPRIPVDQQVLDGSTQEQLTALRLAREAKAQARASATQAIAAAEPVTALGREVKGRNAASVESKDSAREVEGKGQALDGERLAVNGREIRLYGIVTPALTSSFGPQTRLSLDRMLSGSNVLCKVTDRDGEGKPVAFCGTVRVPDLSYEMLRQGWAMVDRRRLKGSALSEIYEKAEQEAQTQNRGIFAPTPVAMAVPVSDPTRAVTVPVPAALRTATLPPPAPVAMAEAPSAAEAPALPDLQTAVRKIVVGADTTQDNPPAASSGNFVERYQILLGAVGLIFAAGIFGGFLVWRENKVLSQRRQALAAALRGELMSARLICRTRARELLNAKKADIEPRHPAQLWPRVRSLVYQAHVSQLGLLGAEMARQVASVYGQCADYAAYYQSNSVRAPIPQVVGETLATLSEHIDTLLHGLQEVEATGRPLLGEDIMAEEERRAAAENMRLAMAAAHKRALPPPTITAEAIKARRMKPAVSASAEEETESEEEPDEGDEPEAKENRTTRPRVA